MGEADLPPLVDPQAGGVWAAVVKQVSSRRQLVSID
jgi:hypothetical protein